MANPRHSARHGSVGIGDSFVSRRHELGVTQVELADLAGVSRSSVQSIELGKRTMQFDVVLAVADALGCDIVLTTKSGSPVRS